MDVSKVSGSSGAGLAGALLVLLDSSGNPVDISRYVGKATEIESARIERDGGGEVEAMGWVSTGEPTRLEGLPVGTYALREAKAPDGYDKAEDVLFEVVDSPEPVVVAMIDEASGIPYAKMGQERPPIAAVCLCAAVGLLACALALLQVATRGASRSRKDGGDES